MKIYIKIFIIVVIFPIIFCGCKGNQNIILDSSKAIYETNKSIDNETDMEDDKLSGNVRIMYGYANQYAINVSIINLIATPEKYDGKIVRVIGIGNIEFESNFLYLSTEDWKYVNSMNSIWLEPDYEQLEATNENLVELNGKSVILEGIFIQNKDGYEYFHSGTITKIHRYEEW